MLRVYASDRRKPYTTAGVKRARDEHGVDQDGRVVVCGHRNGDSSVVNPGCSTLVRSHSVGDVIDTDAAAHASS